MADSYLDQAILAVTSNNAASTPKAPQAYNPEAESGNTPPSPLTPPPVNQPDLPIRGGQINAPAASYASGPAVVDPQIQQQNPGAQFIARGRQTVFGLNYDGSLDQGDTGVGFFRDPVTNRPYDTRDSRLVGASLNTGIFNGTIGNRFDKNIQAAVSKGQYKVQVTTDDGKSLVMPMTDVGPAGWTGNAVDLTKGAADALGIKDNSIVNYQVIGPDGKPVAIKNAPPVPITPVASGQTRATQYKRQLDEYYAERQPYAPGLRIATPEQVAKWDYAVQNGQVDPNSVSPEDKLAINLAKDPQYLVRPENADLFYHFVAQPLFKASPAEQISSGLAALPAAGGELLNGLKAAGAASLQNAEEWGKTMWNGFSKAYLGGQNQVQTDPTAVGNNMASGIQGMTKGVADVVNMANGAQSAINMLGRPIIENFIQNPNQRAQLDRQVSDALQTTLRNQINSAQVGAQIQQGVAGAFKALGQSAVADALSNASPNQRVVNAVSMVANPLNYIPFGEGMAASKAVVPSFFEHALADGENLGGKIAENGAARVSALTPDGGLASFTSKPLPNAVDSLQPITTADIGKYVAAQGTDALNAEKAQAAAAEAYNNSVLKAAQNLQGQNGVAARAIELTGQGASAAGKGLDALLKFPQVLASKLFPGNPVVAGRIADSMRWLPNDLFEGLIGDHLHSLMAGLAGGHVAAIAAKFTPDALQNLGEFLTTAGKELTYGKTTLPYWNRVAQETSGLGKGIALALDRPSIYTLGAAAKGAIGGGAVGAGLNALSNPLQPYAGAAQGLVQGGILGMAGGGFGQIRSFNSPSEHMAQMIGDWNRYRDILPAADKANFGKLSSTDQLALSQFNHQFPGLKVNYFNSPNGEWGYHNGSIIGINQAIPGAAIKGVLAHEFSHSIAESGMLPELYKELLGEPATKTPGQYTLKDSSAPDGVAHVDPNTGRYKTDQEFQNLKNEYLHGLADKNLPTSHITDFHIAKEIFAEHGADYALSGQGIINTHSAYRPGWFSNSHALKDALMKMGLAFDHGGDVVQGTGLFRGQELTPNSAVSKLLQTYYQKRFNERKISSSSSDEMPDRAFTKGDLIASPTAVDTWFDSTPSVLRDKNGVVQKDGTGAPILRKQSEISKYNTGLTRAVNDYVESLPEDRRAELGVTQKGAHNFTMRYLPDGLLNQLASKNQYNPTQINNLKTLSKSLADKGQEGRMFNFFYQTASKGKQYATLAGAERNIVPYLFETTADGNVNLKGVDFAQLTNNYLKYAQRNPTIRNTWQTANDFNADVSTYFANHAGGKSGADGIGVEKRDAINALAALGTVANREMNPFSSQTPQARSIIKSFRIDRINRLTPLDQVKSFTGEQQYSRYLNPNYNPGPSFIQKFADADFADSTSWPASIRKLQTEYDNNNEEMMRIFKPYAGNPGVKVPPETMAKWGSLFDRQADIENQVKGYQATAKRALRKQ